MDGLPVGPTDEFIGSQSARPDPDSLLAGPARNMTRVALFGATGMAGQGVLRECLRDPSIASVLAIGRRPSGKDDPKLRDVVVKSPAELKAEQLGSIEACLYCVGTASAGVSEAEYTAITKDMALLPIPTPNPRLSYTHLPPPPQLSAADSLLAQNPNMRFLFISGDGTDAKSRSMWARVKGETELAEHCMSQSSSTTAHVCKCTRHRVRQVY
ncbi:hypothetical protein TSOC_009648 [Tetrabaena socialis]|uniref:NAD(P)-binding domain-containing protein n=1 Tax=Tetrabaena socialis TaxID=47790 RepID=A0A2J7ZVA7_9CHLO|nr:hypothetical protein TSOC_009648 [Tetrabaena socialis]|eukprot:PNH04211.1 hypothetical protein TSOC_009648 [Tetrabaena socialis]